MIIKISKHAYERAIEWNITENNKETEDLVNKALRNGFKIPEPSGEFLIIYKWKKKHIYQLIT